jgi:hypothetical protein
MSVRRPQAAAASVLGASPLGSGVPVPPGKMRGQDIENPDALTPMVFISDTSSLWRWW